MQKPDTGQENEAHWILWDTQEQMENRIPEKEQT